MSLPDMCYYSSAMFCISNLWWPPITEDGDGSPLRLWNLKKKPWKPLSGVVGDAWTFGDQQGISVEFITCITEADILQSYKLLIDIQFIHVAATLWGMFYLRS